jgi:hypothetical protein
MRRGATRPGGEAGTRASRGPAAAGGGAQAAQVQWWLPWKVRRWRCGATRLVAGVGRAGWWGQQATDLQALRAQEQLARGLSASLTTTRSPQRSKAQQEELLAVSTAAGVSPRRAGLPGQRTGAGVSGVRLSGASRP